MNSNSIGLLAYSDQHLANLPQELKKVDVNLPDAEIAIGLTLRKRGVPTEILKIFEGVLRDYTS